MPVQTFAASALLAGRFARLRQIVELLGQLGQLDEPISTPGGLRAALELLVQVGTMLGIDAAWIAKLQSILSSDAAFRIVLALVRLAMEAGGALAGEVDDERASGAPVDESASGIRLAGCDNAQTIVTAQALADWLPIVVEIIALLRALRGGS
jgi:hypothetical protein